jgi:hypothetical protein
VIAAAFRDLAMALSDVAFERSGRANNDAGHYAEETRREALSQALLFNGFARALLKAASAIEARQRQDREAGPDPKDESAVTNEDSADAQ